MCIGVFVNICWYLFTGDLCIRKKTKEITTITVLVRFHRVTELMECLYISREFVEVTYGLQSNYGQL